MLIVVFGFENVLVCCALLNMTQSFHSGTLSVGVTDRVTSFCVMALPCHLKVILCVLVTRV
jgi:hypothetical protein